MVKKIEKFEVEYDPCFNVAIDVELIKNKKRTFLDMTNHYFNDIYDIYEFPKMKYD